MDSREAVTSSSDYEIDGGTRGESGVRLDSFFLYRRRPRRYVSTFTSHRQYGICVHVVVTVKVEFAFPPEGTETLVGFRCGVIPLLGDEVAVRLTVPEKLLMLATVMIAEPQVPGEISSQFELTEKSGLCPKASPIVERLRTASTSIGILK